MKIGQYPTYADLHYSEVEKYKKFIEKNDYVEFKRAEGLFSHGIGVGSFVYLRRIFERQIYNAFEKKKITESTNTDEEDAFLKMRMEEKVEYLSHYLPQIIIEEKASLYFVISKGIHELSEEECREFFPVLKGMIIEMFDENKVNKERGQRRKEYKIELTKIKTQLKNSN